ncbi:MAG: PQQ-binding-like beta-propeller repeat protein [Alphaproteobacteria bacterium]
MTRTPFLKSLNHYFTIPLATLLLTGCSLFVDKDDIPLEGERISILELQKSLEPDDAALQVEGLITPSEWRNEYWPQRGGYPNHSMQNLALSGDQLTKAWSADIGKGTTKRLPLNASPIVVDGTIYTLDAEAKLSAFTAETGKKLWSADMTHLKEEDPVITGGIAYSGGALYITNGYNELLAVNPKDGAIYWRRELPAPSRAAPTVIDGRAFVTTLDNKLLAIDAKNGAILWEYLGINESAGIIGAASPAASRDVVIPVFSSGEITALRVANGSIAWTDSLSGLRSLGGLTTISDIKALPVMDKGLVIAISFSGRIVAIDERTGTRVWQREIGGSQTPWMAGNHLFVLSSENQLIALGRDNGTIRWVTDLPKTNDDDPIVMTGPVLAGGRLIIAANNGYIYELSPETGALTNEWKTGKTITTPPIVAGGTLYLLDEDGTLSAYR